MLSMRMHRSAMHDQFIAFITKYDILGWGSGYLCGATFQKYLFVQLFEEFGENASVRFRIWIHPCLHVKPFSSQEMWGY